jgi:hypothetical protein
MGFCCLTQESNSQTFEAGDGHLQENHSGKWEMCQVLHTSAIDKLLLVLALSKSGARCFIATTQKPHPVLFDPRLVFLTPGEVKKTA